MGKQNLYPGINPHLNSHLQHITGWKGFHNAHLVDIARMLDEVLPPTYYTGNEESLQIKTHDQAVMHSDSYDIHYVDFITNNYDSLVESSPQLGWQTNIPTLVLPVLEMEEEPFIGSVVIFEDDKPVTRIELLSPANKPPGSHAEKYQAKREFTLQSGLALIEIDYLHAQKPIDNRIPSYPDRQPKAYPYYITVSNPRPLLGSGKMRVFGFGVMDAFPIVDIPLIRSHKIAFNFGAAYQRTFEESRIFYEIRSDYHHEPVHFDDYAPEDQVLIRQHMTKIND